MFIQLQIVPMKTLYKLVANRSRTLILTNERQPLVACNRCPASLQSRNDPNTLGRVAVIIGLTAPPVGVREKLNR